VTLWFDITTVSDGARIFTLGQGLESAGSIPPYVFLEYIAAGQSLAFGFGSLTAPAVTASQNMWTCTGALAGKTGTTVHLAAVHTSSAFALYINGAAVTCTQTETALGAVYVPYGNYSNSFISHSTATGYSASMEIYVFNFQMYVDALSSAAITTLFTNGASQTPTALAGNCPTTLSPSSFTNSFPYFYLGKDFVASAPAYFNGGLMAVEVYNFDIGAKGIDTCGPAPPPLPPLPPTPPPPPYSPPPPPLPPGVGSSAAAVSFTLVLHNMSTPHYTWAHRVAVGNALQALLDIASITPNPVAVLDQVDGSPDDLGYDTVRLGAVVAINPPSTAAGIQASLAAVFPAAGGSTTVKSEFNSANSAAFGGHLVDVTLLGAAAVPAIAVSAAAPLAPSASYPGAAVTLNVSGINSLTSDEERAFGAALGAALSLASGTQAYVTGVAAGSAASGGVTVGVLLAGAGGQAAAVALLAGLTSPGPVDPGVGATNMAVINSVNAYGLPGVTSVTAWSPSPTSIVTDPPFASVSSASLYPVTVIVNGLEPTTELTTGIVQAAIAKQLNAQLVFLGNSTYNSTATEFGFGFLTTASAAAVKTSVNTITSAIQQSGLPQVTGVAVDPNTAASGYSTFTPGTSYAPTLNTSAFTVSVAGIASPPSAAQTAAVAAGLARALGYEPNALYVSQVATGLNSTHFYAGLVWANETTTPVLTELPASSLEDVKASGLPQTTGIALVGSSAYTSAPLSEVYGPPGATFNVLLQNITIEDFGVVEQRAFAAAVGAVIEVSPSSVQITYTGASGASAVDVGFGLPGATAAVKLAAVIPSGSGARALLLDAVQAAGMPAVTAITLDTASATPLQSVEEAVSTTWGNATVSAVFRVTTSGAYAFATATLTGVQKSAILASVCQTLGVSEAAAYVLAYKDGASAGIVNVGFNFNASAPTPDALALAVSKFNSTMATALIQNGGFPQVSNVALVGTPVTSQTQNAASSTQNTFVSLSLSSDMSPTTALPVQRAIVGAVANALGVPGCCDVVDTNGNLVTISVNGASSATVNDAVLPAQIVGFTSKGGNMVASLVATGFLNAANPSITTNVDTLPSQNFSYGVIHTFNLTGVKVAGFSVLQQSAFQAVLCATVSLPPGCSSISGMNDTATGMRLGVLFGTTSDALVPNVTAAMNAALIGPSLLDNLRQLGLSQITAISGSGVPTTYLPAVIVPGETTTVTITLGVNNVAKGSLSNAQMAAFIAAVSQITNTAASTITVTGISASAHRRALLGVVGTGPTPDTYVGISIQVPSSLVAAVVTALSTNDQVLLTALQNNGLPEISGLSVGNAIVTSASSVWSQPAAAYAYANFQLRGVTVLTNATAAILRSAVSKLTNISESCFVVDGFNQSSPTIGLSVVAPCVNTTAQRFTVIATLNALMPSTVNGSNAALANELAQGGLPQLTMVTQGAAPPPPSPPPPSPPPPSPPPPMPPSPPPPPGYALHQTDKYLSFRYELGAPVTFKPYFDYQDSWLPYIKERIHQLLIPAVQYSTYEQIDVTYNDAVVVQAYAEYRNSSLAPSKTSMEDAVIKLVYDACGVTLPRTNVSLSTNHSALTGSANALYTTTTIELETGTNTSVTSCEQKLNFSVVFGGYSTLKQGLPTLSNVLHVVVPVFDSRKVDAIKTNVTQVVSQWRVLAAESSFAFDAPWRRFLYKSQTTLFYFLILSATVGAMLSMVASVISAQTITRAQHVDALKV
jgi:hypothetical protein